MTKSHKKLIEIALPLQAVNKAARDEKAVPRSGHPQTLHYWWARRPIAAARVVNIVMTRELSESAKWGEDEIRSRGQALAEMASQVWFGPVGLKEFV
jgi:adenine-specific DNA methylase